MRIDSHQHYWSYDPAEYSWIDDNMTKLKKDYQPEALKHELFKVGFDGAIAVQARNNTDENEFLLNLAHKYPDSVLGVVGWMDLCRPDVYYQIETYSSYEKFVGVRHIVQDEPDDDFMLREDFQNGIAQLSGFGLTYDLVIFPRHLARAIKLVERFPDQRFVLDHIGKPNIKDRIINPWKEDIEELAWHRNVYCKLSGMVTETDWNNWSAEDFRPYLDIVFRAFGVDRLMIGSDWPVCLLAGRYTEVMDVVLDYTAGMSQEDKDKILGDNCTEFYGI